MKIKVISFVLATVMACAMFTGCNKKQDTENSSNINSTTNSSQKQEDVSSKEETAKPVNPFTGAEVESPILNRPLAVMVNNVQQSLPQAGIGDADIIFELPVEGAITRLMAVFADYKTMPNIGSIRSARHDYVELIKPFNPIYLHFGASQAGKDAIKNNNIDDIDGLSLANVAFYQDKERLKTKAREHTWFSNLKCLENGIAKEGFKTTMDKPINPMFEFATGDTMANYPNAVEATNESVKMSNACTATFTYDNATQTYKKGQYGADHIDTNKNKACSVKNVLVMYTNVGLLANKKNKEVDLANGTGFYISNGKKINVTFEKKSVDSYLTVKDETGAPLKINVGQTWVCIAPKA